MPEFVTVAADGQAILNVAGTPGGVSVATQAELDAHAAENTGVHGIVDVAMLTKTEPVVAGVDVYVYGASLTVGEGEHSPQGNYPLRLGREFRFVPEIRGIGGTTVDDQASRINAPFGEWRQWTPGDRGLVVWDLAGNDMVNKNLLQANKADAFERYIRTGLMALSCASKSETATTETGAWSGNVVDQFSGGSYRSTSTSGDWVEFTVTAGQQWLWLNLLAWDSAGFAGATVEVTVDGGSVIDTIDFADTVPTAYALANAANRGYYPYTLDLGDTAGHTVRFTTTTAGFFGYDCQLVPSSTPPEIIVLVDHKPNAVLQSEQTAAVARAAAAMADLGGHIHLIDPMTAGGFNAGTMIGADGVHLTDIGHAFITGLFRTELRALSFREGLNNSTRPRQTHFAGGIEVNAIGPLGGNWGPARFWGQQQTSGSPSAGTWRKGDWIIDVAGTVWVCTVSGSPGTWASAVYDSGWTDVSGSLVNGWTATTARRRRIGDTVHVQVEGLDGTSATDPTWVTLPTGYRPVANLAQMGANGGNTSTTNARIFQVATTGDIDVDAANVTNGRAALVFLTDETEP